MTQDIQKKSHGKLIAKLLLIVFIFPVIVLYFGVIQKQKPNAQNIAIDGLYLKTPSEIADFHLTDNQGNSFTRENLKGHWTLLFFGFTNCGAVCPTTMSSLNKTYKMLQEQLPDKKLPQVVLISVDPERDSIARLNSYVKAFNPHFMGARTDAAETIAIEKQFHIAAAKMQAEGSGKNHYTINHTADVLLVNPEGKLQAFFSYPLKPEKMVNDYKLILSA